MLTAPKQDVCEEDYYLKEWSAEEVSTAGDYITLHYITCNMADEAVGGLRCDRFIACFATLQPA